MACRCLLILLLLAVTWRPSRSVAATAQSTEAELDLSAEAFSRNVSAMLLTVPIEPSKAVSLDSRSWIQLTPRSSLGVVALGATVQTPAGLGCRLDLGLWNSGNHGGFLQAATSFDFPLGIGGLRMGGLLSGTVIAIHHQLHLNQVNGALHEPVAHVARPTVGAGIFGIYQPRTWLSLAMSVESRSNFLDWIVAGRVTALVGNRIGPVDFAIAGGWQTESQQSLLWNEAVPGWFGTLVLQFKGESILLEVGEEVVMLTLRQHAR